MISQSSVVILAWRWKDDRQAGKTSGHDHYMVVNMVNSGEIMVHNMVHNMANTNYSNMNGI